MQRKCQSQFANLMPELTFLQAVNVVLIYGINTVLALRPGLKYLNEYYKMLKFVSYISFIYFVAIHERGYSIII